MDYPPDTRNRHSDFGLAGPNPLSEGLAALSAASPLGLGAPSPTTILGIGSFPLSTLAPNALVPSLAGLGLAQLVALPASRPFKWQFVRQRFTAVLNNLAITQQQREEGDTKRAGVSACLNRRYWEQNSETANSMVIGSWAKQTRIRPPSDVDILFLLPPWVYWQYASRSGNRQSQLLQDVKTVLTETYPRTAMRADGQVVVVPFDNIKVEVSPGFRWSDGSIKVCDANGGGHYTSSTAEAELADLNASDAQWNGNSRALARMMKAWRYERNVPIKPFQLERLAVQFLNLWWCSAYDVFWYDWMVRDFLAYLIGRANTYLYMPGTGEAVWLGDEWLSRAQTAYQYAVSACDLERDNYQALAGNDWQQIFGSAVPVLVT
jgi:hypothetical protein